MPLVSGGVGGPISIGMMMIIVIIILIIIIIIDLMTKMKMMKLQYFCIFIYIWWVLKFVVMFFVESLPNFATITINQLTIT